MTERLRACVIGTGRMGAAMTGRLRRAGADVTIFNRTRTTAQEVASATGAVVAGTPAEAVAGAPVVLVSLADDQALLDTYGGRDGIAAGVAPGAVVADTSTVDPQTIARLAPLLATRHAGLVDAPVSGSVPSVERGELTVLAGGDAADLDRARPVLGLLARQVFHVGASGAGAAMKLAVNTVVHGLNQALAEALVLAETAGIDRNTAYDVIAASAAGAPFVQYKRTAFVHPEQAPVAFSLDLVAKDLGLILGLAQRLRVEMPQAERNRRTADRAVGAGLGGRDMSALTDLLRGQSG